MKVEDKTNSNETVTRKEFKKKVNSLTLYIVVMCIAIIYMWFLK